MSDVIDFLEKLGQNAHLRHIDGDRLEQDLAQAGIDASVRAALLSADPRRLEELLGASTNLCCLVEEPSREEEEEDDEDEDEDEDEKEEPPKVKRPKSAARVAVAS